MDEWATPIESTWGRRVRDHERDLSRLNERMQIEWKRRAALLMPASRVARSFGASLGVVVVVVGELRAVDGNNGPVSSRQASQFFKAPLCNSGKLQVCISFTTTTVRGRQTTVGQSTSFGSLSRAQPGQTSGWLVELSLLREQLKVEPRRA